MRANVIVGTAGETILEHGFEQEIAEPRYAGPTLYVGPTMRSQIEAIPPLVDQLMPLIKAGHCVPGDDSHVEIALREALANAVLHGNNRDIHKKVHASCRIHPGKELSIVVQDEGNGFDPAKIPDPTAHISAVKATLTRSLEPGSVKSLGNGKGVRTWKHMHYSSIQLSTAWSRGTSRQGCGGRLWGRTGRCRLS